MAANKIIRLKALDGQPVEFRNVVKAHGTSKDIYFSVDDTYVVAFYKKPQSPNQRERINKIVGEYRKRIFTDTPEGYYWKEFFAWPQRIVEWDGRLGIVMPKYSSNFFFKGCPDIKDGVEKSGGWFTSAKIYNRRLPDNQKGDWRQWIALCIRFARAVRRMHAAGLAHSDLSYNNVLVDPLKPSVCIIDIDSLVVPPTFLPEVDGTKDFMAPEVVETCHLPLLDPKRSKACINTDRHAMAVLIYMYLFQRHPLRTQRCFDDDDTENDRLMMGSQAVFIEHPTNDRNRVVVEALDKSELPQGNPALRPYTFSGPYLTPLFDKAFIEGLHNPAKRPSAMLWESALMQTFDILVPCSNPGCQHKFFVCDVDHLKGAPQCPFCGQTYNGAAIVCLDFYYAPKEKFIPENRRLLLHGESFIHSWHAFYNIAANEKLTEANKKPLARVFHKNGQVWLNNLALTHLYDNSSHAEIPIGGVVQLTQGHQLLFEKGNPKSRLAVVRMLQ